MKEIIFILIYLYIAGFIIFGFSTMASFHLSIVGRIKNLFDYTNNNSSKVRDYAVIIVCICAVIAMIIAIVMISKMK